jgi:hypothetical protein
MEENVYSLMTGKQFAKEIGRTLVVSTAQTTGVYLGMAAILVMYVKVVEVVKNRKKKD